MKFAVLMVLFLISFAGQAASHFECEFTGPNYILTLNDDDSVTLSNHFKSYSCSKGTTTFPGTDLDLKVLNCSNGRQSVIYYYADYLADQIFLSKNLGITKDIVCNKI